MNGPDTGHVVYFAGAGQFVKVGYSANVLERMRDLQTSNPEKIVLLYTIGYESGAEARRDERYWRQQLKNVGREARGEWVGLPLLVRDYSKMRVYTIAELMALPRASRKELIAEAIRTYGLDVPFDMRKLTSSSATCNI